MISTALILYVELVLSLSFLRRVGSKKVLVVLPGQLKKDPPALLNVLLIQPLLHQQLYQVLYVLAKTSYRHGYN